MNNEQIEIFENLKYIYPFNKLDSRTLEEISLDLQITKYIKEETIFDVNDHANDLYFLIDGNIKLLDPHNENGKGGDAE